MALEQKTLDLAANQTTRLVARRRIVTFEASDDALAGLKIKEEPVPTLGFGQARIEVLRAPINPTDLAMILSGAGVSSQRPARVGTEGLGRIIETRGPGLAQGQLVLLPPIRGTWATEVTGETADLVRLPDATLDQLSMLAVNPVAAHLMLTKFVALQPGDWVIQSAANSAVGGFVNQLAKARGIHVVNVVRRKQASVAVASAGGAHIYLDGPDLAARIDTDIGQKMALALDPVAGKTFGNLAETLAEGGTLVLYGAMAGETVRLGHRPLIYTGIRIRGFWLTAWFAQASKAEQASVYRELADAVAAGWLKAPIAGRYSLDQVHEAVRAALKREREGKILLLPNGA